VRRTAWTVELGVDGRARATDGVGRQGATHGEGRRGTRDGRAHATESAAARGVRR
jgi:hypothetical protein